MIVLNSILTVYTWGIVCIILYFLFLIGRFYEQKSGRRSFYRVVFIPLILFALTGLRYAWLASVVSGDWWGDMMRFVAGVTLGSFGIFLLRLMTGDRP